MNYFTQSMTLMGTVTNVDLPNASFILQCHNGENYPVYVHPETFFGVLRNLDGLGRNRVPPPEGITSNTSDSDLPPPERVRKYIRPDALLVVQGMDVRHESESRFQARTVTLMHSDPGKYVFEETHWWLTQIARLADEWLDDLFKDRRAYDIEDFAELYRTNLNLIGQEKYENIQECATLSRLIYGLSSAYLLTGNERYLHSAKAGVEYQRESFRSLSHDRKTCLWNFGKRRRDMSTQTIVASENPDDYGTIPLYEQIYALAGLSQFYRITQDWEVLEDIQRTVAAFQRFYLDTPESGFGGTGGYFSHIDPVTLTPDTESLGDNRLRKNWNSIGDHIPAYLINLILALDPIPRGGRDREEVEKLLESCRTILDTTSRLILEKFPDHESPYVNERFHADWTPDHQWRWQQDRAIVGHNLKIAWNLTRVANYYRSLAARVREQDPNRAQAHEQYAQDLMALATRLGDAMEEHGIDQVRGGCFDAVERHPQGNLPIQFTWGNTKDFWQQEQGILAYLILHGATTKPEYLALAREMIVFWNLFFLDHDNRGIYFRVSDEGMPVIDGAYANKAGHAIAGYHTFELNYLAHIYTRSYVKAMPGTVAAGQANFCIFFHPDPKSGRTTINTLPDFFAPAAVEIASITINGVPRASFAPDNFQVELAEDEIGSQVVVEFRPKGRTQ
jgi:mannose/cellobiose epimerase-like protein (N-acyl-D-glucosamine 2-epimerase family)